MSSFLWLVGMGYMVPRAASACSIDLNRAELYLMAVWGDGPCPVLSCEVLEDGDWFLVQD